MAQQRLFDLGPGDVVAGRDDQVVGAALVDEVAVGVLQVGVAGEVPAALHVLRLARVVQVAAAGGAFHGQPADGAGGHRLQVLVEHAGAVAGNGQAGGPRAGVLLVGRDEDVQQLGGPDAVDQLDAGGFSPQRAGGHRQRLAGRDTLAQRAALHSGHPTLAGGGGHRPVRGGRGEQHRGAVAGDAVEQVGRRGLGQQHGGRADLHRKQQQPAESESEGQRRAADEHIVGMGAQHMRRKTRAGRHQVAVKVHRGLGLAGGAAGEGQQADIVGGGVDGGKAVGLARRAVLQPRWRQQAEVSQLAQHRRGHRRLRQLIRQRGVAQRVRHLRLVDDPHQLFGAQHRHRAHRDAARLHHRKPAGRQHR